MKAKLYRVAPDDKICFSSGELLAAKFCHKASKNPKPDCEHTPYGEWYCMSEDCVVREVRISCKLFGEKMPTGMKCPVCQSVLKFHNWIEEETLVECGSIETTKE